MSAKLNRELVQVIANSTHEVSVNCQEFLQLQKEVCEDVRRAVSDLISNIIESPNPTEFIKQNFGITLPKHLAEGAKAHALANWVETFFNIDNTITEAGGMTEASIAEAVEELKDYTDITRKEIRTLSGKSLKRNLIREIVTKAMEQSGISFSEHNQLIEILSDLYREAAIDLILEEDSRIS